jgi:hypothetical protein
LRASVGSTEASASLPARVGVVGPTRAGPSKRGECFGLVALRRPAGERRRRGPGSAAAAIGLAFTTTGLVEEFILRRFNLLTHGIHHDTPSGFWPGNSLGVGAATRAAWMLLLAMGRWRPGRSWREWTGIAPGAAWLAEALWAPVLEPLAQLPAS